MALVLLRTYDLPNEWQFYLGAGPTITREYQRLTGTGRTVFVAGEDPVSMVDGRDLADTRLRLAGVALLGFAKHFPRLILAAEPELRFEHQRFKNLPAYERDRTEPFLGFRVRVGF